MKLTKHAHACIEVEHDGRRILIDPGAFTPDATQLVNGADSVLITHSHQDHVVTDMLAAAMRARGHLAVYGPESVVVPLRGEFGPRACAVAPGDVLEVEGLAVTVHGGLHARVFAGAPRDPNVGYLLGGRLFHPGDSFDPPGVAVETLLVPVSGPWMKLAEAAAFVDAVKPRRAVAIHEALLSRIGLDLAERILGHAASVPVEFVPPGTVL